ncbi:MAG: 23S rRNA (pseudouridine(1915)-N(3))-methyltransferase RlmH [Candidatus Cloacimonetes bacterium]|nr:23S rRNA (pseudouridine(1915)-N(3))-methyltransferase RlmH [Candidatus Cloacimonadota bacterium]MCF7814248.1 23S rRNA (pseudouridine(1915)-N(3))-methyltransferase RlmH [Candidatus Cloacimonadota bacterium]MCF7868455.1 23S rRNA (pseudouridine(1915)-N(3))-methyltransferase RlmH [Candidatus Cloacimonadota bacterium]MCF7883925.1 23S rRNA (pseudouridine(1915)-N(3))-methyltransferase RlmH [Candidatus Cloacimonadota bacterium]
MKIKIICVGKTKQKFIEAGIAEYKKRLQTFAKIETIILPDVKLTSSNNIDIVKKQESEIIRKHIKNYEVKVALDENGKSLTSKKFADFFVDQMNFGKDIAFFIGGVYGFEKEILNSMDMNLSFSRFTFTHQMIRLILFEQIYRAFTIIKGKRYHY